MTTSPFQNVPSTPQLSLRSGGTTSTPFSRSMLASVLMATPGASQNEGNANQGVPSSPAMESFSTNESNRSILVTNQLLTPARTPLAQVPQLREILQNSDPSAGLNHVSNGVSRSGSNSQADFGNITSFQAVSKPSTAAELLDEQVVPACGDEDEHYDDVGNDNTKVCAEQPSRNLTLRFSGSSENIVLAQERSNIVADGNRSERNVISTMSALFAQDVNDIWG
ncbi:unnamed protein product [Clavelina lepadiformis]|uniref:Uncharacterized protein n=1 Tax=Clavelina lepadiformis TaxID=159417 RepID=A0ABP0GKB2_CLALP